MAIDNRLQVFNEEGQSVDYDILASDVKFLPDGKDLPTKLAEIEQEIEEAGSGDGTVTGVKVGSTTYEPTEGVVDLSTPINTKVDKNGTDSLMTAAEHTKLQNLPTADQLTTQLGGKANDNAVVKTVTINGETKQPQNGNVSFNVQAGGETVVINSDGANIVDSHTNPSILVASSARQMYMAAQNIETLFRKVNDLYDKLAGIAFTDGKPASWKEYADWSTPTIPEHTITLGTMSNVSVYDEDDNIVTSPFDTTEGEVTLKLTPAQDTMILTENISIKLGTKDVPFTTSADNGSTLVTFVLAGDVTISASASSGIGVQVNGNNVSANVNGIALSGDNRTIILSHPNHFEWDGSIGLSVNSVALVENTDYTLVSNQDGTKTITVLKTFTSDAYPIVITASVVEDDHAVLDLTNVGSGVNVNKDNNAHVYVGDTITILPASGNKVTASATIGGNAATLTGDTYAGYSYTIGSGDVSSGGTTIAITATASALNQSCQITLPSTGNGIASAALTDMNGTAITSPVVEGTGIKIVLTPDTDFTISTISIANLTEGTDYNVTDNNGVKTITIQHVTGNVVVTAAATQPTVLETNLKWFVEPTEQEKAITEGQQFSIDLIPLTNFVAAASQPMSDDGTTQLDTPKSIRAAVQVIMNGTDITSNTGVVTYDETNNKVTVNISNPSGRVVITAAARLTLIRNKYITKYGGAGVNQGVDATGIMATKVVVPVPAFTGYLPVQAVRWQFYNNVDNYNSCMVLYKDGSMIRDSYWSWGSNATNGGRTVADAQYINGMNGVKASFKQGEIDSESSYPGVYVNGTGTNVLSGGWLPVISKDDLLNALHVDS